MNIIEKMISNKQRIKESVIKEGMEEAINKFTLKKLIDSEILSKFGNTNLYVDVENLLNSALYNENGQFEFKTYENLV